jgi:23S rRNA A2030 N6-methylase RlmJ
MPYDHSRNVGNRGDVWKHFMLVAVAEATAGRETFRYFESHAGAPSHQLRRGGTWKHGIGRVLDTCHALREHPYFEIASAFVRSECYPASWWFVADRLASKCRHVDVLLTDLSEVVADRYTTAAPSVAQNVTISFEQANGFLRVRDTSQADLFFIDPPFHPDAKADWKALRTACKALNEDRCSFLAWYPIYWETEPQRLVDTTGCLCWELTWAQFSQKPSQNMKGCGMLASADLSKLDIKMDLRSLAGCLGGSFHVRRPSAAS